MFYSSGRCSNEGSYLYSLFVRLYGNNNLPGSSNMCHETTSVALPESIGVPVGTVRLDDFAKTDCILFFRQNVGSNSPRVLHALQEASRRGVPIITYNPLRERGLESFINPQSPVQMLSGRATRISSQYHQVKAGGDLAALAARRWSRWTMPGAVMAGDRRSTTHLSASTRTGSVISLCGSVASRGRSWSAAPAWRVRPWRRPQRFMPVRIGDSPLSPDS